MKKYIALIVLAINFFKLTYCMEASSMDVDPSEYANQSYQPIDIDKAKAFIKEIFQNNENLTDIFGKLMEFFDTPEFSKKESMGNRLALTEHIKKLVDGFYELENESPNVLTKKLKNLIEKNLEKDLTPQIINEILFLICSGADPNVKIAAYNTKVPLLNFCILHYLNDLKTFIDIVPCLLIYGADANYSDIKNDKSIFIVARNANLRLVRLLIIFGADVYSIDWYQNNVFDNLNIYCDEKTLILFLGYGYKFESLTNKGNLVIRSNTDPKTLRLLIRYSLDINARDKDGMTALHKMALSNGFGNFKKILKILLKCGAIDLQDDKGITAYKYATMCGNETIKSIFEKYNKTLKEDNLDTTKSAQEDENDPIVEQKTSFMDTNFPVEEGENDYHMADSITKSTIEDGINDDEIIKQLIAEYQLCEITSPDSDLDPRASDDFEASYFTDEQQLELEQYARNLYQKILDLTISQEERNKAIDEFILLNFRLKLKGNL